jgi:hypothetical protein
MARFSTLRLSAPIAALILSACGGTQTAENNLSAIDNQIAQADIDPAITTPIEDQILVDPGLVGQSNPNAVRPPERPLQAPYPTGDAAPRGMQQASASGDPSAPIAGACGVPFQMGNDWAQRLPAEFPLYPGATVTEAAGVNAGNCRMRVVSFTTGDNPQRVLDFYSQAAQRAGFDAERQTRDGDQVLGGTNQGSDGAYYLIVTPREHGAEADLIVNGGR